MEEEGFAGRFADDLQLSQLNLSRDLMQNAQYVNATHAISVIETDKGGLPLSAIWEGTEWLCSQMLLTDQQMRPFLIPDLYAALKKYAVEAGSKDEERSVMCIMMLFALRLTTASKNKEDNPNAKLIRAIVRLLVGKMKENEERMDEMKRLLKTIDVDGDDNERDGTAVVQMGVDILEADADWKSDLRAIVQTYINKADSLVDYQMSEAFDAVWEELLEDNRFVEEMKEPSLKQSFNLNLLFNVFGLMFPDYYKSTCRGASTIAKAVGADPTMKDKDHHYSKDYFSIYQIEKLKHGFKSDDLLNHVKGIIHKHKKV